MAIERLTDATFERTIHAAQSPILVSFSAPIRCPACRAQKPALEMLAAEGYPVYYLNVEEPDSAYTEKSRGGKGVPFNKVYMRGKLVLEHLGMMDARGLKNLLVEANQKVKVSPPPKRGGYASVGGFLGGFGRGDSELY